MSPTRSKLSSLGSQINTFRLLAVSLGVQITATSVAVSFGDLAGAEIAPDARLRFLPMAFILAAASPLTVPASLIMQRYGRRRGFALGSAMGAVGSAMIAEAIVLRSFVMLCAGCICLGGYQATAQYYRFAATEGVLVREKGRATSQIMIGISAMVGPAIAIWAQRLLRLIPLSVRLRL